jgi:hypothetical protein
MTAAEEKLLEQHKKLLEQFNGFLCSSCNRARRKKEDADPGHIDLFVPKKKYKLVRTTTYAICNECMDLPADTVYNNVENWLMERGHLIP